jgi:hypothetical protein
MEESNACHNAMLCIITFQILSVWGFCNTGKTSSKQFTVEEYAILSNDTD